MKKPIKTLTIRLPKGLEGNVNLEFFNPKPNDLESPQADDSAPIHVKFSDAVLDPREIVVAGEMRDAIC